MRSGRVSEPEASFINEVAPGSYTAHRLVWHIMWTYSPSLANSCQQHATPQHLHLTTRRCFIGPIPQGWLKSHRKSWYKEYLSLANYSSRAATFSAGSDIAHRRQITGLDGPSASATLRHSFPQPEDAASDDEGEDADARQEPINTDEVEEHDESWNGASHRAQTSVAVKRGRKPQPRFKQRLASMNTTESAETRSFVTAPTKPRQKTQQMMTSINTRKASFVTASESCVERSKSNISADVRHASSKPDAGRGASGKGHGPAAVVEASAFDDATSSTTSLLHHGQAPAVDTPSPKSLQAKSSPLMAFSENGIDTSAEHQDPENSPDLVQQPSKVVTGGLVKFNVPGDPSHEDTDTKAKLTHVLRRRSWRHRHGQGRPGEIVKMEKMLVRIDSTMNELEPDYDENSSLKVDVRPIEKWREYVVVCRESPTEDSDYSLQMYKTRVIPAVEETDVQKRSAHELPLKRKATKINLYSSLDKTLVIWVPWRQGRAIYILRTRSAASSVEWYTFLRGVLGHPRTRTLEINVPDLSVSLQLEDPFGHLESSTDALQAAKGDEQAIAKIMEAERAVAGDLISRSMKALEESPEWSSVLDAWLKTEKMGLAWKRYDRLEWIHGANEHKMYGTMAMQKSHELELRPKRHYPTNAKIEMGVSTDEPAPVEGFLIRLTSQRGRSQRFGKMFFKRLYFTTHNQYLCYCRPAKALPPPPPRMKLDESNKVPSAGQIVEGTPLIYAVNPYPLQEGQVEWLKAGNQATRQKADSEAYKEAERNVNSMLGAEGYINLSHVVKIGKMHRGASPADENVDQGPDVDFHRDVLDTSRDDGKTDHVDDHRTFEMMLRNGLVIRLQAYDEETKNKWMTRLEKLVRYWKLRLADDMKLFQQVRQANLKTLDIDEESEAYLGQFGHKWEVTRSIASPQLFNMCGISCCRAITMAGTLYHKPRRHTTFLRCGVILCHGQLLIFHGTLRERTGKEVPHIQHERQNVIDLKDCYIYSGLITEGDLLYQNQTFDSNRPGHHALPRAYLEDGWTSTDEDTMTCFVIWQARKRSFFKSNEDGGGAKTRQRLRYVSQLGVPGRSIVFKTRSRAERDHWVMSIDMEIERLQQGEEIRIVPKK